MTMPPVGKVSTKEGVMAFSESVSPKTEEVKWCLHQNSEQSKNLMAANE
jgi:hypothetical protein